MDMGPSHWKFGGMAPVTSIDSIERFGQYCKIEHITGWRISYGATIFIL